MAVHEDDMFEFRLPELAPGMQTATLANWLKREGDAVVTGEPIAEIETDKTSIELESPRTGVLRRHLVPAGSTVTMGAVLATIDEGAATASPERAAEPVAPPSTVVPSNAAPALATSAAPAAPAPTPSRAPKPAPPATAPDASERSSDRPHPRATPLAARMAELAGVDLSTVSPRTGDRITKADIDAVLGTGRRASASPVSAPMPTTTGALTPLEVPISGAGTFEDRPLTAMRRTTAARLQHAKQTIPHFYLQVSVAADAMMTARAHANASRAGAEVTITDFLVFAASRALREVPSANAAWADSAIRHYESVDIAVAVNTPKGLVAPVLRRCHEKSLGTLSRELKALAARAREGALVPEDYAGGTFTISNLGMYGVTSITPIVNPPHAAILGVGAIEQRPVVRAGQLAVGHVMECTLAADHRVLDGAAGAELLVAIRRWLEDPMLMALGS